MEELYDLYKAGKLSLREVGDVIWELVRLHPNDAEKLGELYAKISKEDRINEQERLKHAR